MFRQWSNSHHSEEDDSLQFKSKVNKLKKAMGPLSGRSLKYYKAKKMLDETLKWRSAFKPKEISWEEVAIEGETGKVYRASFHDRYGRSVFILRPGMQNTQSLDNQMRHLVYLIENAILNLPEGQEQLAWLIDFTGWSLSTNVPIKSARESINILQNHYPERLAVAFLYNPPRIFEVFWKV
ncbi:hypothetical protein EUGRSUZ_B00452 [Eucalyptus grandis]|uniref:CRAL-TRIO domain-containing protein n=2 Tax=Eucalyptus grandis TaxID=71139 RepID=A0A059CZB7_EUCGR|nr:hypothetical protein EUGRSUZ_B00452 [Eucalyptus grandis]